MRPAQVYWQIYRRDRIKPELRGRLIYVLEIPAEPGGSVVRHIFDPTGMEFPASTNVSITSFLTGKRNGIIFDGVNKSAVCDVTLQNRRMNQTDNVFDEHNRNIIRNCEEFLLNAPLRLSEALTQRLQPALG